MYYVFSKTSIGYSHLASRKTCQDYSSSYKDKERVIITCCDGHGGKQYIRSELGSKLASQAVFDVLRSINNRFFLRGDRNQLIDKIKISILCEYNKLIEREIASKPVRKKELEGLSEEEIDTIRFNPAKAYGTTLSGALIYKDKLIVVSIGDTEAIGVKNGQLIKFFDNSNDPAGNVTYSMCQEDAYQYLRVNILEAKDVDAVLLCTDGLASPYQSYDNFFKSFIKPAIKRILLSKSLNDLDESVVEIATKYGVGDDVSLSLILNKNTKLKYYR